MKNWGFNMQVKNKPELRHDIVTMRNQNKQLAADKEKLLNAIQFAFNALRDISENPARDDNHIRARTAKESIEKFICE